MFESILDKNDEKVVHEKTYRMKLEFYDTDRKMENVSGYIFISIIMHPNLKMHFRQKISFKSALKAFSSLSGYLRTVLKLHEQYEAFRRIKSTDWAKKRK